MTAMKRIITAIAALLLACTFAASQLRAQVLVPEGYVLADSLVYHTTAAADSSLYGKNIFSLMPSKARGAAADVVIHQSDSLVNAMSAHVQSNSRRAMKGYRVRVFFDNRQDAREAAQGAYGFVVSEFGVRAYLTYSNPYFKVTAGDFRTRSEATAFLNAVRGAFPSAFIVKENINMPSVHMEERFTVDTVKVLRKIQR